MLSRKAENTFKVIKSMNVEDIKKFTKCMNKEVLGEFANEFGCNNDYNSVAIAIHKEGLRRSVLGLTDEEEKEVA